MATLMKGTVFRDVALCSLSRGTNVWKKTATFILRVKRDCLEDGDSRSPRKVCVYLPNYTASHFISQLSSDKKVPYFTFC